MTITSNETAAKNKSIGIGLLGLGVGAILSTLISKRINCSCKKYADEEMFGEHVAPYGYRKQDDGQPSMDVSRELGKLNNGEPSNYREVDRVSLARRKLNNDEPSNGGTIRAHRDSLYSKSENGKTQPKSKVTKVVPAFTMITRSMTYAQKQKEGEEEQT
jgi:hypothetical protein